MMSYAEVITVVSSSGVISLVSILMCHVYILGMVVAHCGMYGWGGFRWPHFLCFSCVPPILLLVLPVQPFTMYTVRQLDDFWHVSHMLGMYGVEMSSYFLCSFFITYMVRQSGCPLA